MTAFTQAFGLLKIGDLEPPSAFTAPTPPPSPVRSRDGSDDELPADECCIEISNKWFYESSRWHEEYSMPQALSGNDDPDDPEYATGPHHTQNACDHLREKLEEWADGRFGEKHSVNYDNAGSEGLFGPTPTRPGINQKLQALAQQLLGEWDECATISNRKHPSSYFTASADDGFDQAFSLLKMPIDWETVTEPVWTDKETKVPLHMRDNSPHNVRNEPNSLGLQSGEASAQWIHPIDGERYNIRMKNWLRNTLKPPSDKPDWEPYIREGGEMVVTRASEEESRPDRTVAGTDFYNHTDPFGRRHHRREDTAQTQDPRSVPMPDTNVQGLKGLGLGTAMYDLLSHWGVPLKPDDTQTEDARRLWARNQGYDRETADMMSVERENYAAMPYERILQQAVKKVNEAGLHNSLEYDHTQPTAVVGYLNIWDAMGYPEGIEIKEWMNEMVALEGLKPFNASPPFLENTDKMKESDNQYERYDRLRPNWTWRGHNERN